MQKNQKPYKSRKIPLWLPYLNNLEIDKNNTAHFEYNGGEVHEKLENITSILIYGESDVKLDTKYIDTITRQGIPIVLHRRNLASSTIICSNGRPDPEDTLTAQITARQNLKKQTHITRALLAAKFKSCNWLVPEMPELPQYASIKQLRNIEAVHAKKYWHEFFKALGKPEFTRREKNIYAQALDANSKFVSSILLRWITYHHLSPYHGFLHEPTTYPTLMYDLFEPYRGIFDSEFLRLWSNVGDLNKNNLTAITINTSKELLNTKIYTPLTRQLVTRQELLHGIVLSLKFYLLRKQSRFLIPLEGKPNGGRPPQVNFLLYGRHAGKTDFWKIANEVSNNHII